MEDPKTFLGYMLLVLIAMFLIWMMTGGPARYETAKPLIGAPGYSDVPE